MHAKPNVPAATASGMGIPTAKRAAASLSAHARGQAAAPPRAAEPVRGEPARAKEIVTWREEVEIGTETTTVAATVNVHTYVTEEKVSRQIPLEHEEATVTKERIGPAEALRLTPREILDDREQVFEIELSMQQAVVGKRLVPSERVKIEVKKVKELVTVDETVKVEHVKVDEQPRRPKSPRVRRAGAAKPGRS